MESYAPTSPVESDQPLAVTASGGGEQAPCRHLEQPTAAKPVSGSESCPCWRAFPYDCTAWYSPTPSSASRQWRSSPCSGQSRAPFCAQAPYPPSVPNPTCWPSRIGSSSAYVPGTATEV